MHNVLFGDVLICGSRGEGRRNWEVNLRYGEKKNHMITFESIEFSFYVIPLYFSLVSNNLLFHIHIQSHVHISRFLSQSPANYGNI